MNTDLVRRWIDDLRYGGHKQGTRFLHAGDTFCCLGRAIEVIYGPEVWERHETSSNAWEMEVSHPNIREHYSSHTLDPQERDMLGLSITDMIMLVGMNDDGKSFSEIADRIELYLDAYAENNVEKSLGEPVLA